MDYSDVIQLILKKEESIVGDLAIRRASKLDFVVFEEDWSVDEDCGPQEIEELLDQFHEIQGKGAYGIFRRALKGQLSAQDDLDLPPEIVPRKVREDRFISSF